MPDNAKFNWSENHALMRAENRAEATISASKAMINKSGLFSCNDLRRCEQNETLRRLPR